MPVSSAKVAVFLSLKGQAQAAIAWYQDVLGGQTVFSISNQEFKEQYNPSLVIPAGHEHYISHSVTQIGDFQLQIADNPVDDDIPMTQGNALSLDIMLDSVQEAQEIFDKACAYEGTQVLRAPRSNEFADFYAVITDPFGVLLQITCEK
ncbi:VOC family protein [Bombiscardovia apis]|uniref:VOC family protein n=1 Tax=Bombiscardovia apis TaxID=2932182 RepID=A0ABN6SII8_9BIFI|nr:VOC family protein [Bombiscardovia apis]BDR55067.1 VOC family protein [Bombiscardovia apis]